MRLRQQHVIITGGSSGIGQAFACLVAHEGASISIIARDPARLATASSAIAAARRFPDQQVWTIAADVADEQQASQALAQAIANQPPDILVTCAGIAEVGRFLDMPSSLFRSVMEVNYFGTLYCVRAVVPAMAARRRGHIVMVSSAAALLGVYGYTAYTPSKFAVRGFAESLRAELKPMGIKVAVVYPPDTDTPQLAYEERSKPEETRKIVHDPLLGAGKVWTAEQVAQVMLRGIRRGSFAISPGWQLVLMQRAGSLLAPLLNWYYDRIVARVQRARQRQPDSGKR